MRRSGYQEINNMSPFILSRRRVHRILSADLIILVDCLLDPRLDFFRRIEALLICQKAVKSHRLTHRRVLKVKERHVLHSPTLSRFP